MSNTSPDPKEFMIEASDLKGHNVRLSVRVPPGMAKQGDIVVQSKKFPYNSLSDLLRHAYRRHLMYLQTLAPVKSILHEIDIINDILLQEKFNQAFMSVFENMAHMVDMFLGRNEKGEAVRLIRTVQDKVEEMDDGYWKERYRKEIDNRWGHIISGLKLVGMEFDGEDD
jgi:secreted Zn-dependent insulinase-like peptidase